MYVYICVYLCIYACMYVYVYMYIYIYTHRYTYILQSFEGKKYQYQDAHISYTHIHTMFADILYLHLLSSVW
jgi:hypothetical protein